MDLPFTRAELKAAIPERCFQPTLARSFFYVAFDLAVIAAAAAALVWLNRAGLAAWWSEGALIFLIGTMCWALFVLGHEAGHGAFSRHKGVNNLVGLVLHGALLVPYRSWQRSHALHHKNTGHLDKEEVFRPARPEQDRLVRKLIFRSGTFLLYGWPMYLLGFRNVETYSPIKGSHFTTASDLYSPAVKWSYLASLATVAGFAALYAGLGLAFGWAFFANYLLAPYLVFGAWLTFVTWMHHVSPQTPIYGEDEWTGLKGALATVDRDYGPFGWLTHRIGDQHVIHHIFPTIPHYRAAEAMRAVAPILGPHRLTSSNFVPFDFVRSILACHYAAPVDGRPGGLHAWRSAYGWIARRRSSGAAVAAE